MDASSLFASGNARYVNEEYEEALKHYTCAITLQDDCSEFRACRAAAYLKLGKKDEALNDAEGALALDARSHMALHWKGIALFYLGNFADARLAFEESLRIAPSGKAPRAVWVRKCDAELSGSTLPLVGLAGASKAAPLPAAAPAAVAAPTPAPVVRKVEPAATSVEQATASAASGEVTISGRKPVRREWYQNNSQVFVTIFQKEVDQERFKIEFQENELSVTFPLPGTSGEEYNLELELFDAVVPSSCKFEISKMKVEITLEKKSLGLRWADLEKRAEALAADEPDQPAYPTSSKTKRDWSQIDRDIETDLKNEKPEGDEALNSLFKQIYDRADEDTRRAMNKSFQTSGGTVLSTNWGEVAKSDYEDKDRPTPPEGQSWKDWRDK